MMNKNDIHNLIKVNPLSNWSEEDVEQYVKKHHVPYNKLQDKGYPSIGFERPAGGCSEQSLRCSRGTHHHRIGVEFRRQIHDGSFL